MRDMESRDMESCDMESCDMESREMEADVVMQSIPARLERELDALGLHVSPDSMARVQAAIIRPIDHPQRNLVASVARCLRQEIRVPVPLLAAPLFVAFLLTGVVLFGSAPSPARPAQFVKFQLATGVFWFAQPNTSKGGDANVR